MELDLPTVSGDRLPPHRQLMNILLKLCQLSPQITPSVIEKTRLEHHLSTVINSPSFVTMPATQNLARFTLASISGILEPWMESIREANCEVSFVDEQTEDRSANHLFELQQIGNIIHDKTAKAN